MSGSKNEVSKSVGTDLLFENDRVRVWGMELQAGESSPYHRHEHDYVYVYTTPSRIIAHHSEQPTDVRDYRENYVQFNVVGSGIEHHITNEGSERHHQIIVELKGGSTSADPLPPENNGRFD